MKRTLDTISSVALLLPETDAHLINADAADNDELAGDLIADVPEHLLAQTMPRLISSTNHG